MALQAKLKQLGITRTVFDAFKARLGSHPNSATHSSKTEVWFTAIHDEALSEVVLKNLKPDLQQNNTPYSESKELENILARQDGSMNLQPYITPKLDSLGLLARINPSAIDLAAWKLPDTMDSLSIVEFPPELRVHPTVSTHAFIYHDNSSGLDVIQRTTREYTSQPEDFIARKSVSQPQVLVEGVPTTPSFQSYIQQAPKLTGYQLPRVSNL
ncbi:MAG TPA: hypothetical protein VMR41_00440 [Patescibacteria group bacterium]|nr:hypothetical protein [Patescibacteria group bacterium]